MIKVEIVSSEKHKWYSNLIGKCIKVHENKIFENCHLADIRNLNRPDVLFIIDEKDYKMCDNTQEIIRRI